MRVITSRTHTYVGLAVGLARVLAPWVFDFDDHLGPRGTAVGVGLFLLVNEIVTTSPASPLKVVPMRLHVALEVPTGVFLAASPFLFGFTDLDARAWVPHVVVGALVVAYALLTDTSDERTAMGTIGMPAADGSIRPSDPPARPGRDDDVGPSAS